MIVLFYVNKFDKFKKVFNVINVDLKFFLNKVNYRN